MSKKDRKEEGRESVRRKETAGWRKEKESTNKISRWEKSVSKRGRERGGRIQAIYFSLFVSTSCSLSLYQLHGDSQAKIQRILRLVSGGGLSITSSHLLCGDFLYSGHTVMLTLTYLFIKECEYSKQHLFVSLYGIMYVNFPWIIYEHMDLLKTNRIQISGVCCHCWIFFLLVLFLSRYALVKLYVAGYKLIASLLGTSN